MSGEGSWGRDKEHASREENLRDPETVNRVFLSGTEEEQRAVQELHGLTNEQMDLLRYYAPLRDGVKTAAAEDLAQREREQPTPTEEELAAGIYRETLEIQVRDAVFTLRRKGYDTYSSGFASIGEVQHMSCFKNPFAEDVIPESVLDRLSEEYKLQFIIKPNFVTFQPSERLTVEELTYIWNTIADAMPDLGAPAPPVNWPSAKEFRAKHAQP